MHQTLVKFDYPKSLLKEFTHWYVLLRPAQATLGALVLVAKSEVTALADLPPAAFAELHTCCNSIEKALRQFRPFDKLNYLALMMVDPQVHFHVLPRYRERQEFEGVVFNDQAWPGPPDLKAVTALNAETHEALLQALRLAFANPI
jgi:diadenosine tetraphosphate (Ap4A) HIT family hydrolase